MRGINWGCLTLQPKESNLFVWEHVSVLNCASVECNVIQVSSFLTGKTKTKVFVSVGFMSNCLIIQSKECGNQLCHRRVSRKRMDIRHGLCNCRGYSYEACILRNSPIISNKMSSYQYRNIGILMLKIRRSRDRLIFNMGILIPGKDNLCIETGPKVLQWPPLGTTVSCLVDMTVCDGTVSMWRRQQSSEVTCGNMYLRWTLYFNFPQMRSLPFLIARKYNLGTDL